MRHLIGELPGKVIGTFYGFAGYGKKPKEEQEALVKKLHAAFDYLESKIQGPYLLGDEFTLADILTYPWFERWAVVEHYYNISIDNKYEKIHKWLAAVGERESVKEIVQPKEFYIEGYKTYFASWLRL